MKTVEIKGVVVFFPEKAEYEFLDYLTKNHFNDGIYKFGTTSTAIFICEHTITVELPADFDIIQPQLNALEAQKKELTLQYKQALNHIQVKRNNLLAIENDIRNI